MKRRQFVAGLAGAAVWPRVGRSQKLLHRVAYLGAGTEAGEVLSASKVAVLINPDDPNASVQMRNAQAAARGLAIELEPVLHIRSAGDLEGVFDAAVRARADAGLRMVDPLTNPLSKRTAALAMEHRLPIIYPFRVSVEDGGLISYGTDIIDQYRQAATPVDKILRGAKPAGLPVEQPT